MKKRLAAFIMALAVAAAFIPVGTMAASSVKMTAYDQVLKSGSNVYCAGGEGLYKVKVKNGKVVSKKLLDKAETFGAYSYYSGMKKKGKYIYVQSSSEGTIFGLIRVRITDGKVKVLSSQNDKGQIDYVIKKSKIYYKGHYGGKKKVMKLNGKNKKKTSVKPVMKHKKSNAKGYSVIMTENDVKATTYLKTPKGTYKLGSHEVY